jgi:hypothetical protein
MAAHGMPRHGHPAARLIAVTDFGALRWLAGLYG